MPIERGETEKPAAKKSAKAEEPVVAVDLEVTDAAALELLGARLGKALEVGLVTLDGPLGAGKTTLCRGLLQGRGHVGAVKSPTYTLVESYVLPTGAVHHFDLYRLTDPDELEFIGLRDYLDADTLCLVEWPARAGGLLPVPDITIAIQYLANGRRVKFQALTARGEAAVAKFR